MKFAGGPWVAVLAIIAGCAVSPATDESPEARLEALTTKCESFGLQRDTPAMADCLRDEHIGENERTIGI